MEQSNSTTYRLLSGIERKMEVLSCSPCLLSVNLMSMSLAVDIRRMVRYSKTLLEQWQECLPLGDCPDVNFALWGNKMWDMIGKAVEAYRINNVNINIYEYESDSYRQFKELQDQIGPLDNTPLPISSFSSGAIASILVCALRELNEVLMKINEFMSSPTEVLINRSYKQWEECYCKHYLADCIRKYQTWKLQYSPRTLKKHLADRRNKELEVFKTLFINDDEFELVYDAEQKTIDIDGLSRFLFLHASNRFGVSYIDARPMFSQKLQALFGFVVLWQLMQNDLQSSKKSHEKAIQKITPTEHRVKELVQKVHDLAADDWKNNLEGLWNRVYREFHNEIEKAGSHEKFKEFSKKTVYCILGHLKKKGVYQKVDNVAFTKALEGVNNGMRKYINNGLTELEQSLGLRVEKMIDRELAAKSV